MNLWQRFKLKAFSTFGNVAGNKYYQSILRYVGVARILYDERNKQVLVDDAYATVSDVYAIVSKIARTAASVEWYVEQVNEDGTTERVTNSKLNELLECPNRMQNWSEFIEEHISYRLVTGDSYIYGLAPIGFPENYYTELNNLQAQNVVIVSGNEVEPVSGYRMRWDNRIKWQTNEVVHIKYPNLSGEREQSLYGMSPLTASARVWKTSGERWEASAKVLHNGGVTGILSDESERPMNPDKAQVLEDQVNEKLGGANKFGRVMASHKKLRYLQLGLSPEQLQLLEQGVISLRALCNAYHISSALFNDPEGKKNNNQKEAEKSLWTDAVIPELTRTKRAINQRIAEGISQYEGRKLRVGYDVSKVEVLQADQEKKTNRLVQLRLAGVISGNEVREAEGFSVVENSEELDAYVISSSVTNANTLVNENEPQPQ